MTSPQAVAFTEFSGLAFIPKDEAESKKKRVDFGYTENIDRA